MNEDTGGGRGRLRRAGSRRVGVLAVALAGIALLVAGCGASGGGSSTAGGATVYQKALAYAECMRSHGDLSWPDPTSQGGFISHAGPGPQYLSANKACERLLPNGGVDTPAQLKQQMSQALNFSACMRSHGVPKFPDPVEQNGNVDITVGPGVFPDGSHSPQVQSVMRTCMKLTHFGPGS